MLNKTLNSKSLLRMLVQSQNTTQQSHQHWKTTIYLRIFLSGSRCRTTTTWDYETTFYNHHI